MFLSFIAAGAALGSSLGSSIALVAGCSTIVTAKVVATSTLVGAGLGAVTGIVEGADGYVKLPGYEN